MKTWIIVLLAVAVSLAVALVEQPVHRGSITTVSFEVQAGQSTQLIADHLSSAGLIRSSWAFTVYARLTGQSSRLEAGTYVLSPSMSLSHIADVIASGQAVSTDIEVTVPEGSNVWDTDTLLAHKKLLAHAGSFAASYGADEGMLFPETYRFASASLPAQIAQRMEDEFTKRAAGYTKQQVIVASILEKEAKTADDMGLVAGIIAARQARGMALQVDATVAYGWCLRTHQSVCDVTQAPIATEIKIDGPYNTYTRLGLPAGPISNPGLQALDAVAHPKPSAYLYYLSTRDGSQLIYAKTLAEHLANRQKYLGF